MKILASGLAKAGLLHFRHFGECLWSATDVETFGNVFGLLTDDFGDFGDLGNFW